jgi:uncharacterized protein (DUF983 family)
MEQVETHYPALSPISTGIRGRCPRCGKGHLFNGFLTLAPKCEVCGLDYSFADPADGPAFFVMCFACVPAALLAVWIEVAFQAPYWSTSSRRCPSCCSPAFRRSGR